MEIYTNLEEKFVIVTDKHEMNDLQNALWYAVRHWDNIVKQDTNDMKETDQNIADKYLNHFKKFVNFNSQLKTDK